jgi:glycosyltransferase involved in cell wall biosynthesis
VATEARWFAVSRFLADALAARGVSATVLPAPVDARPKPPPTRIQPERWVYVGRATAQKGGDRFVRLVAHAGVEGVIYGEGPTLPAWRALATELGAPVRFAGRVSRARVLEALSDADLALLLPRVDADGTGAEGFGLALVEAAAAGLATVGCRTGGVPEAVGAGLILEDPDDVEASAAAIRRWLSPERAHACWAYARDNHGIARVVDALRSACEPGSAE